jgi:hypothetical protein
MGGYVLDTMKQFEDFFLLQGSVAFMVKGKD